MQGQKIGGDAAGTKPGAIQRHTPVFEKERDESAFQQTALESKNLVHPATIEKLVLATDSCQAQHFEDVLCSLQSRASCTGSILSGYLSVKDGRKRKNPK